MSPGNKVKLAMKKEHGFISRKGSSNVPLHTDTKIIQFTQRVITGSPLSGTFLLQDILDLGSVFQRAKVVRAAFRLVGGPAGTYCYLKAGVSCTGGTGDFHLMASDYSGPTTLPVVIHHPPQDDWLTPNNTVNFTVEANHAGDNTREVFHCVIDVQIQGVVHIPQIQAVPTGFLNMSCEPHSFLPKLKHMCTSSSSVPFGIDEKKDEEETQPKSMA